LLTAKAVTQEPMQGDPNNEKYLLHFEEDPRGLVLNVTNARALGEILGDDSADWPGQKVVLYATTTDFAGTTVDCIRVRAPKRQAAEATQPTESPDF
jgi:hypothetical protein